MGTTMEKSWMFYVWMNDPANGSPYLQGGYDNTYGGYKMDVAWVTVNGVMLFVSLIAVVANIGAQLGCRQRSRGVQGRLRATLRTMGFVSLRLCLPLGVRSSARSVTLTQLLSMQTTT